MRATPPAWAERLLGHLLPRDEAEELLGDLAEIHAELVETRGHRRANRAWWRLAVGTLIARRGWGSRSQRMLGASPARRERPTGFDADHEPGQRGPDPGRDIAGPGPRGPENPRGTGLFAGGLEALVRDISLARRAVVRRPGQSLSVVATLALAIGINTGTFSVVNAVLLRPLPYPSSDRLVALFQASVLEPETQGMVSEPNFRDWQSSARGFVAMATYRSAAPVLTGLGDPEVVPGGRVSEDFFRVLGRPLLMGRSFTRSEIAPDAPGRVVVSEEFWRERLSSDPAVLGRTLILNGEPHDIVGVAPTGLDFPGAARIWMNEGVDVETCGRGCVTLDAIGRLEPGVVVEDARAELASVATRIDELEGDDGGRAVNVVGLQDLLVGDVRRGLLVLLGAVGLVLLIACANVGNLLLAGAVGRRHEVSVRAALGAGRARIVRQLLMESLLLATAGGVLGLLLSYGSVRAVRYWAADAIPRLGTASVDGSVLAFTLLVLVDAALLFGLAPALTLGRVQPARVLVAGRGRTGDSPRAGLGRAMLIAVQVGLSVALLAGTALLVQTLAQLQRIDPGFDPENVEAVHVSLPSVRYDGEAAVAFFEQLERSIAVLPGVESVGGIAGLPLGGVNYGTSFDPGPGSAVPEGDTPGALLRPVLPGYFATMRIPLLEGRSFTERDTRGAQRVVVVSRALADQIWPNESPLGHHIDVHASTGFPEEGERTVVGVADDVRSLGLTQDARPELYIPHAQAGTPQMTMTLRLNAGRPSAQREVREILRAMDPEIPLRRAGPVSERLAEATFTTRFYSTLLTGFTTLAVALAVLGLWGVVSYQVARRRREVGVRMAVGASARDVVGLFAWQGIRPALVGLVLGIIAAVAATDVIAALLYNTSPRDVRTWAAVAAGMIVITCVATFIPAARATRVAPAEVLRAE